ncbi:MAG: Coenzyme F420 hydrogenase/dehydrogenase, beta subunit C-terminal domain [Candidatus Bipolaricaulota bacterium]
MVHLRVTRMPDRQLKNVAEIFAMGLCMGCGTCVAACPQEAIRMVHHTGRGLLMPQVDQRLCTACGRCVSVCPGHEVDLATLTRHFINGGSTHTNLGTYEACYTAYATDGIIRRHSASGGVVSALVCHLLDSGVIHGALTVQMSSTDPLRTEPLFARSHTDMFRAAGSKYCPTSTCEGLQWLREGPAYERYAFVGLPCQIQGLRKLMLVEKALQQRIVLCIGLFCANNNTSLGTEYFLRSRGVNPSQVADIRYRDGGWPGKIAVALRNGQRVSFPRATTERHWARKALFASAFHYDFQIPRCLVCPDQTAELADIAAGDPWLREIKATEKEGLSFVIVRSSAGREALESATSGGVVEISPMAERAAARAQNYSFKNAVGARIALRRWLRRAIPKYGERPMPYGWRRLLGALRYIPSYCTQWRAAWPAVKVVALTHYLFRTCLSAVLRGVRRHRKAAAPQQPRTAAASLPANSPRLLLVGAPLRNNLGGPSLLFSTVRVLRATFPDVAIQFSSADPQDALLAQAVGLGFVPNAPGKKLLAAALLRRSLHMRPRSAQMARLLDAYAQADAVVDIWGIGFSDQLGSDAFRARATQGFRFLAARVMRIPVVKYTADLGPFDRRWNRFFSRLYLNRSVDLILARSATTASRIKELGVRTPVHVLPDTAFLLDTAPSTFAEHLTLAAAGRPIIGVSVSHMAARQAPIAAGYCRAVAVLADEIVTRIGAKLVFIPNETSPKTEEDDRATCREVMAQMQHKGAAVMAPAESLSASELKGVIGTCSVVVASRYHTIVAALSMAIPVLAIGWHAKYESAMDIVGQAALVADVRTLSADALCGQFFTMWQTRAERSEALRLALPALREQIMAGGALVRSLLEHHG